MLQALNHPLLREYRVSFSVWREDLNHPIVSGNKWHKLQPWLNDAMAVDKTHLMSFGGRHSNHLHALAYACWQRGWSSTGWVRGHADQGMTATMADCLRWGMHLQFVSFHRYRQRNEAWWWQAAGQHWPQAYVVPEGGTGPLGVAGVARWADSLVEHLPPQANVLLPVGSGGTLIGFLAARRLNREGQVNVVAVPVFKSWQASLAALCATHGVALGEVWPAAGRGFGRTTAPERAFDQYFQQQFGVRLDPVYTLKVAWQFWQRLTAGQLKPGSNWVLVHTGGLQGRRDWESAANSVQ